jgi:hypothetical protein
MTNVLTTARYAKPKKPKPNPNGGQAPTPAM